MNNLNNDEPSYFVINPYHVEITNAPLPYAPLKRYQWWDGTCIKVINKEKFRNYWVQAWRKELIIGYDDIDRKFNKKMREIQKLSDDLNNIKRHLKK